MQNPDLPKLLRAMADASEAKERSTDVIFNAAADRLDELEATALVMPTDDSLRGLARSVEEIARAHPRWSQVHHIVPVLTGYITALARISEINQDEALSQQVVEFDYVNWRGNPTHRKARLLSVRWGTSEWYETPQWLVSCWDLEKKDIREFALANMTNVKQQDRQNAPR